MSRHKQMRAQNKENTLTVTEHVTDSPLLPVNDLERLHEFRPDLVDFVINQTDIEAKDRRDSIAKINKMVFIEQMAGKFFAFLMGLAGISASVYLGLHGHDWLAGIVSAPIIGTLAVSFLRNSGKD